MKEMKLVQMKEKSFGELIKKNRKSKKFTLQRVSDKTRGYVSPSYISRLEKSEKESPAFSVVCEIANALEMDLEDVFRSFGYEELILKREEGVRFNVSESNISTDNELEANVCVEKIVQLIKEYVEGDETYGTLPQIIHHIEQLKQMK